MQAHRRGWRLSFVGAAALVLALALAPDGRALAPVDEAAGPAPLPEATLGYSVGPIQDISAGCPGTGDTSEASDPALGHVYMGFEGCDHDEGIGFVRSLDGSGVYSAPVALPDSAGAWDPSLAVAPDGTLYAAFMKTVSSRTYPVIDVSHDYGQTFTVEN